MSELTETLAKKVGPLPLGVWILAVGGGVAVAVVVRRSASSGDETPTEVDTSEFEQGGNPFTPGGVGGGAGGGGLLAPAPTKPTTNDEWLTMAVDMLVAKFYSASIVSQSLGKWLAGESLSQPDRAIVDTAVRLAGSPPVPPPPSPNAPPPVPQPKPRPVKPLPMVPGPKRVRPTMGYTIKSGESLASIAAFYKAWAPGSLLTPWNILAFRNNRAVMDAAARKKGAKNSNGGNFLVAGTRITLPSDAEIRKMAK